MNKKLVIGVLALQGAVQPHKPHIEAAGATFAPVKTPAQFDAVDAFILPGGESTTMLKLIDNFGLWDSLAENFAKKPVWGICAGSILIAEKVLYQTSSPRSCEALAERDLNGGDPENDDSKAAALIDPVRASASNEARQRDDGEWLTQKSFGLLPITIQRNGYGRQLDSHHSDINGYKVSFIRAPVITEVGQDVEILATHENTPVWVKKGRYMATTFHPELTREYPSPMHKAFIALI